MKVWVAAKTEARRDSLLYEKVIPLGHNVIADMPLAHVSLTPFIRGSYALDVIGADTNKAWIFEVTIPDSTQLSADPSREGPLYHGDWRVSNVPIPIDKILSVVPIPNVRDWEALDR